MSAPKNHQTIANLAQRIRRRVLEHTLTAGGGYLSQACSSAEIFATLYSRLMRLGPSAAPSVPPPFLGTPGAGRPTTTGFAYNGPHAPGLDRFYLSCVQYASVLYAVLVETERMSPPGLAMFNADGGTVEMIGAEHSPGHEVTGGSLGQTLSQAAGVALARRLKADTGRTFVFMSDGEFESGQTWEAMQAAAHFRLDGLLIYVDVNGQQCDGPTKTVSTLEPLHQRLAAFGARVARGDGHDIAALIRPARRAPDGRPLVVLADTDPTRGLPILKERAPKLHYVRFKDTIERDRYQECLASL